MTPSEDSLVIGLGANVGGDDAIVKRFDHARAALGELGHPTHSAALYRTAAFVLDGAAPQPDYLNTAVSVRLDPDVTAAQIGMTVRELEVLLGRDRRGEARWAPRTIDLDVILWGSRQIRTPELEIPHPRWKDRLFVVQPLVDLFGEDAIVVGHQLGALAAQLASQRVERVSARW